MSRDTLGYMENLNTFFLTLHLLIMV